MTAARTTFQLFLAVVTLGALSFCAAGASAPAALYFAVPASAVPVGGTFSVSVMADASQPLNAYAIQVRYEGTGSVRFLGTSNAQSLITVWQGQPVSIATGPGEGTVSFGGGSLTPFEGRGGELMTLNFAAIATGTVNFSFGTSTVYLANGKGTRVTPQMNEATAEIGATSGGGVSGITGAPPTVQAPGNAPDTLPPSIDYLAFVGDPGNANQKFVAFRVSDTGSGVASTELRARAGVSWSEWQAVQNPARVPAGVWEADLKTTDNAGNAAEQVIYDWSVLVWSALAALVALAGAIAIVRHIARRRGRRET